MGLMAGTLSAFALVLMVCLLVAVLYIFRRPLGYALSDKTFRRNSFRSSSITREGAVSFDPVEYRDESEVEDSDMDNFADTHRLVARNEEL